MSCAWSAALAEVSSDPGASAVVMQISAAEGGETGVRNSATLLEITAAPAPCCSELQFISELGVQNAHGGGGLAVFLNTRGRFKARTRGDSCLFHVCGFRAECVSSHSSKTSKNRLLSAGGGSRTHLPPAFPRGEKVLQPCCSFL